MRFPSLYSTRRPSHHLIPSSKTLWFRTIHLATTIYASSCYIRHLSLPNSAHTDRCNWLLACRHTIIDAQYLLRTPITPASLAALSGYSWYLRVYDRFMAMLVTDDELRVMIARLEKLAEDVEEMLDRARDEQVGREEKARARRAEEEQRERRRWV
ncbi:hypothetical protein MMC17_003390 [Xylographa soralifera]|nr:hypothetical protein [Xylographa soralifera]